MTVSVSIRQNLVAAHGHTRRVGTCNPHGPLSTSPRKFRRIVSVSVMIRQEFAVASQHTPKFGQIQTVSVMMRRNFRRVGGISPRLYSRPRERM